MVIQKHVSRTLCKQCQHLLLRIIVSYRKEANMLRGHEMGVLQTLAKYRSQEMCRSSTDVKQDLIKLLQQIQV